VRQRIAIIVASKNCFDGFGGVLFPLFGGFSTVLVLRGQGSSPNEFDLFGHVAQSGDYSVGGLVTL